MQVHGINAHVGITLEDLLIAPVWHERVQAADLIVISNVEHLSLCCRCTGNYVRPGKGQTLLQ